MKDPLGHETVFTYDANGNQKTVKDARLNTTTYEYDDLNRRTKTVFPSADGIAPATFTQTTYDDLGRRSERDGPGRQDDELHVRRPGPACEGHRRARPGDDATATTSSATARARRTPRPHDAVPSTTSWAAQTARILPDGKREEMTYDAAGNLKTRTDFMGRHHV